MMHKTTILGLILLLFLVSPASATWGYNSSYPYLINNPVSNGTGVALLNLSNACGTNNATWVFGCNHISLGWLNATHANINWIVTANNATSLPFVILNISADNQTALIAINHTVDGDEQIYYRAANRSYNNLQGGNDTFPLWDSMSGNTINTNLWTINTNGGVTETGGALYLGQTGTTFIRSVETFGVNYSVMAEVKIDTLGTSDEAYVGFANGTGRPVASVGSGLVNSYTSTSYNLGNLETATSTAQSSSACGSGCTWESRSTYHIEEMVRNGNNSAILYQRANNGTWMMLGSVSTTIPITPLNVVVGRQNSGNVTYNWIAVMPYPKKTWGTWGATQSSFDIISWSNNYTNNENLSISVQQNTNIKFSITPNMISTYNWTVNGINQNQNADNFTITALSLTGYTIIGSAYNSSTSSTVSKTWIVSVTALPYTGGEGQITNDTIFMLGNGANITILALQNFTQIELFNSSEPPQNTLQFLIKGSKIQFNSSTNKIISNISYLNNIWNFTLTGTGNFNVSANLTQSLFGVNFSLIRDGTNLLTTAANTTGWVNYNLSSITSGNYSITITTSAVLISPTNNSINIIPTSVNFIWADYPILDPNTLQIATDSQFIGIILISTATSTTWIYNTNIPLSQNTQYYWRTKHSGGSYGAWFTFNTGTPITINGSLNITAKDEQTYATIDNFTAQAILLSTSVTATKNSTAGWVNFTSSEVSSGEYLIRIIPTSQSSSSTTTTTTSSQSGYIVNTTGGNTTYPNISSESTSTTTVTQTSTGYASRSILTTSPSTVTIYLPSSSGNNIIDTIVFTLIDYTNKFSPYQSSYLNITKNNSLMHSSYFDGSGAVATYLLRGDSYTLTVNNPTKSNMQQWGNYVSVGSGSIPMVIMDITVNQTTYLPLTTNLSWSNESVDFTWNDRGSVMSTMAITVYKTNTTSTPVYDLTTTINTGVTSYTFPDKNALYYVIINATTTNGKKEYTQIIDLTANKIGVSGMPIAWTYVSFSPPRWLQTAVATIFLFLLAGTFGALHRGEGSIITGVFTMLFWYWGWLYLGADDDSSYAAGVFLGSILLFAILYHLESKRRQQVVY